MRRCRALPRTTRRDGCDTLEPATLDVDVGPIGERQGQRFLVAQIALEERFEVEVAGV
jgi:hypothetical protein